MTMFRSLPRVMPAALLVCCATLLAQAPAADTAAVPPPPPQVNLPQRAPLNPNLPTIFVVGDSTASNGPNLGWGDHLGNYFDLTKVNVANRAIAGRNVRPAFVCKMPRKHVPGLPLVLILAPSNTMCA